MNTALIRLELRRASRNRRTLFFSAVFPLVLFLVFSTGVGTGKLGSLKVAPYIMIGLATYGALTALFTGGGIIAGERSIGWPRQLRVAGLSNRDYVIAKVFVSYLMAIPGLLVVLVAGGVIKNIHLSATTWVEAAVSILFALLPIAALGVAVGYSARPQSLQVIFGGGATVLGLVGGLLVPAATFPTAVQDGMKVLPTYWAGQAGRKVLEGSWLGVEGVAIIAVWTVVLGTLAAWLFRRDSLRPSAAGST